MGPAIPNREQVEFSVHETRPDPNVVNNEKKKVQLNFLNTRHLTPLLPSEIPLENVSPKRRWLYLQSITSKVWKRWNIKWNKPVENLKKNNLVIVLDPNQPRGKWLRGRIEETYPDKRGHVRTPRIYTAKGIFVRPVTKLILLVPGAEPSK